MPNYKLTYFNVMGVSEPIRYIFAYSGVPFVDDRIEKEQWAAIKADKPFGQMPVLDTGEDILLTQSVAIARFLGNQFKLMGRDNVHNAQLDGIVDHMQDLHWQLYALIRAEENPVAIQSRGPIASGAAFIGFRESFENETLSFYLEKMNGFAAQGALYGTDITWADCYFAGWVDTMETRLLKPILASYPNLQALHEKIKSSPGVKAYLSTRPVTTM